MGTTVKPYTHRHKASGNWYWEIDRAMDCTNSHGKLVPVVIYRGADGQLWVRQAEEFDRNFEKMI